MRESGNRIRDMEEDMKNILMVTYIWESLIKVKHMAKVDMNGFNRVKYMMVNGPKVLVMDMVSGKELINNHLRNNKRIIIILIIMHKLNSVIHI